MINWDVWKRKRAIAIVRAGVDSPGIRIGVRVRECSLTGPSLDGASTRASHHATNELQRAPDYSAPCEPAKLTADGGDMERPIIMQNKTRN